VIKTFEKMIMTAGLLSPLEVKGLTLKNRITMPPMHTGLATPEGAVTEKLIDHYIRHARNLGLLIVEHSYVSIEGKFSKKQLGIFDNTLISGLEKLTSSIHALETPIIAQINHAGKLASRQVTGRQPVAPSGDQDAAELKIEQIENLTELFAKASERAMKAGFDGVEIHGAHGFLLNQFYSPLTNRRNDKYGGSLENRIRFPLEVVKRVKEKIGGRLLLYRLGANDLDPSGTKIHHSQKFTKRLEGAGVDIIDVSGGLCGSRPEQLQNQQGYFVPQAKKISEVIEIPVIGVGGITEPEFADRLIREGKIDLVAIGRKLLEDPEWVKKAIEVLETS
jgi:2,4-dienoyl-CoA reductase-like NADH-dependent reductase (Old Yellow Enzyme family)